MRAMVDDDPFSVDDVRILAKGYVLYDPFLSKQHGLKRFNLVSLRWVLSERDEVHKEETTFKGSGIDFCLWF